MTISAAQVKELREKTGAGMMDCKRALEDADGDVEKAIELLRKKGIAAAEKRAGRAVKQGLIDAYIHPGNRLGVLIEINCETDFVAKNEEFGQFVRNMAMQVAASNPRVVKREQLAQEEIDKELEIYRGQAKEAGKPDQIIDKIAQGKLEKFYQEVCLMEQSFIRDPEKTVQDVLTDLRAKIGENIIVRRFQRFQIG
ncbi:MAG: translation elongation factor Ts [bacterium]